MAFTDVSPDPDPGLSPHARFITLYDITGVPAIVSLSVLCGLFKAHEI